MGNLYRPTIWANTGISTSQSMLWVPHSTIRFLMVSRTEVTGTRWTLQRLAVGARIPRHLSRVGDVLVDALTKRRLLFARTLGSLEDDWTTIAKVLAWGPRKAGMSWDTCGGGDFLRWEGRWHWDHVYISANMLILMMLVLKLLPMPLTHLLDAYWILSKIENLPWGLPSLCGIYIGLLKFIPLLSAV